MLEGIDPNYAVDIDHNDEIRIIRALEIYKNSGKNQNQEKTKTPEPSWVPRFWGDTPRGMGSRGGILDPKEPSHRDGWLLGV